MTKDSLKTLSRQRLDENKLIEFLAGRCHETHQRQADETLMLPEDTHHGAVAENHQSTDDEDKHELETRSRKFHNSTSCYHQAQVRFNVRRCVKSRPS